MSKSWFHPPKGLHNLHLLRWVDLPLDAFPRSFTWKDLTNQLIKITQDQ